MTNVRHRIFITYRRDDTRGAGSRLYDRLRIAFGHEGKKTCFAAGNFG